MRQQHQELWQEPHLQERQGRAPVGAPLPLKSQRQRASSPPAGEPGRGAAGQRTNPLPLGKPPAAAAGGARPRVYLQGRRPEARARPGQQQQQWGHYQTPDSQMTWGQTEGTGGRVRWGQCVAPASSLEWEQRDSYGQGGSGQHPSIRSDPPWTST